jgi:CRP/FNR family transcriptional regulator, cyclic AMP receptor protein
MECRPLESCARLADTLAAYGISSDLAAEIEAHLIPVTFEKRSVVFLRGTSADLLFWVLKGLVKLYLPVADGNRTLVDLARPGDLIGFVNQMDSTGRSQVLEAQALTKCSIGLLSRQQLTQLLRKLDHETAVHLIEHFNTAWSMIFTRYVTFIRSSFRQRLEQVLRDLGERFGANDRRGTLLVPELSHEDLAEMIGSSRPMVSKLIADMTNEGLLTRGEKRRFILRPRAQTIPRVLSSDQLRPPHLAPNGGTKWAEDAFAPSSSPTRARSNISGSLNGPRSTSYRSIGKPGIGHPS